jgi:hypothetical protein
MARNTQLVEIDLQSGVFTYGSRYAIGARLVRSINSLPEYRYPVLEAGYTGPWMHRQPQIFSQVDAASFTGGLSMRDIAFHHNTVLNEEPFAFAIGANASNLVAYWRSSGGAELKFASGTPRYTLTPGQRYLGCSAYWSMPGIDPNPIHDPKLVLDAGVGVTVFSHSTSPYVYYLLDHLSPLLDTTVHGVRSLTNDVPGCPDGCTSMAIHLDRLWMLTGGITGSGISQLWYTDQFRLDSIRSTSVIQVEGQGICLLPGQFGSIDNSLIPRLLIFTLTSVHVLDGDPQLGGGLQADFRTLRIGLGARSPHAACMTPFGAFFLGTDGNLWNIPPGADRVVPVGGPILDRLAWNALSGVIDAEETAAGSLIWYDPYLYIFPGGDIGYTFIAEPSFDGIKFWGPMTPAYGSRPSVVRAPLSNFSVHAGSVEQASMHAIDATDPLAGGNFRYRLLTPISTRTGVGGTSEGRAASLRTGLLSVPGHTVRLRRVILETMQIPVTSVPSTPVWSVAANDERGNVVNGTLLPEPPIVAGAYSATTMNVQHFAFPPLVASRGVSIAITATVEANLGLSRAFAEIQTTPSQF